LNYPDCDIRNKLDLIIHLAKKRLFQRFDLYGFHDRNKDSLNRIVGVNSNQMIDGFVFDLTKSMVFILCDDCKCTDSCEYKLIK